MRGRVVWRRSAGTVLVLAGVGGAVGGCANAQEPDVRDTAVAFAAAGPEGRCELFAPATVAALTVEEGSSCADAVGQVPAGAGRVLAVEVWGEEAQVRLSDDTLFLTRTDAGWRVSAAACRPAGDRPYRCALEGS
jgi:hypothetical protein